MKGNYEPDTFTENDVLSELDGAGLQHKNGHHYILSQCPTHEDKHPSVQIYKDDWFVNCHAGCGRYHITKAFPELRRNNGRAYPTGSQSFSRPIQKVKQVSETKYKTFDLMDMWESMPEIPSDHVFKGIDIDILNSLGWRYDQDHERYFIPYFSRSKTTIPFAQWRNLKDGPRFNFWKDAKPTMYGTWNLELSNSPLFLVEGASDAAVLDFCAVPWISAPSAASGELVKKMAGWCKENGIKIVYAGDNDEAGDKLKEALDSVMPYRVKQPPKKYKDWGDFFIAEGHQAVQDYCLEELNPQDRFVLPVEEPEVPDNWKELNDVDKVMSLFPGAEQLELVNDPVDNKSKEQSKSTESPQSSF